MRRVVAYMCLGIVTTGLAGHGWAADSVSEWVAVLRSPTASHEEKWAAQGRLVTAGLPAVQPLIAALDDDRAQYYAIRALGHLKSPAATQALSHILLDRGYGPRRYAALALGQIGDPKAVPALQKALSDVPHVRADALDALVKVDSRESREALEEYHFAGSDRGLRLRISCPSASYAVGDRITIEANLTNVTQKTLPIVVSGGNPMAYLVFQRSDGSFVESVEAGLHQDRGDDELSVHELGPGAALEWRVSGAVEQWTMGEKDDQTLVPSREPFLTLSFGRRAFHVRRPGGLRAHIVLRQDGDVIVRLRRVPALARRSADVGLKKVVSNEVSFSVVTTGSRGGGAR
jgi:hypothetical protein